MRPRRSLPCSLRRLRHIAFPSRIEVREPAGVLLRRHLSPSAEFTPLLAQGVESLLEFAGEAVRSTQVVLLGAVVCALESDLLEYRANSLGSWVMPDEAGCGA
jgi:hypothetical protein